MQNLLFSKKIFLLIFTFSFLIFLFHTYYTKTAIFADGRFYYATTRSLVKDFDINFENDLPPLNVTPTKTVTGYVWNKYPPGVSFAWTPLFFITEELSHNLNNVGISIDTKGLGLLYQSSIALSSIFLGVFGLYLLYQLLKDHFTKKISMLTIATLFSTTNLLFYISVEPINSHAVSFFTSTLLIFYFLKYKNEKYYYLILGLLGGIAGLVRTQDLLILILPVISIFFNSKKFLDNLITKYFYLFMGALVGFLPQVYYWKKIFGTIWYSPYIDEGFSFSVIKIFDTLFNSLNGLFYVTPVIAICTIGSMMIWRENRDTNLNKISSLAIIYFLTQLLLVSFWSPSIGGSFSNRMLVTTYPLLAFGLAKIIDELHKKVEMKLLMILLSIFVVNNAVQIVKYLLLY